MIQALQSPVIESVFVVDSEGDKGGPAG